MRLYCLTYDAIDSKKAYANNLKERIVKVLEQKGATNLDSPVASTILFGAEDANLKYWGNIIRTEFGSEIYFFLCLVSMDSNNRHFYRMNPDKSIEKNFDKIL